MENVQEVSGGGSEGYSALTNALNARNEADLNSPRPMPEKQDVTSDSSTENPEVNDVKADSSTAELEDSSEVPEEPTSDTKDAKTRIRQLVQEKNSAKEEFQKYKQETDATLQQYQKFINENKQAIEWLSALAKDPNNAAKVQAVIKGEAPVLNQPQVDPYEGLDPIVAQKFRDQDKIIEVLHGLLEEKQVQEENSKKQEEINKGFEAIKSWDAKFDKLCEENKISSPMEKQYIANNFIVNALSQYAPEQFQTLALEIAKSLPDTFLDKAFKDQLSSLENVRVGIRKSLVTPPIPASGSKSGMATIPASISDEEERRELVESLKIINKSRNN